MGMYTEFFFRTTLKKDLPADVLAVVKYFGGVTDERPTEDELPDHPLFKCYRWEMLGRSYGQGRFDTMRQRDESKGAWGWDHNDGGTLAFWCEFKNYESEIQKFIDWITPHLASTLPEYLGYSLYEEDDEPRIYMSPDRDMADWITRGS